MQVLFFSDVCSQNLRLMDHLETLQPEKSRSDMMISSQSKVLKGYSNGNQGWVCNNGQPQTIAEESRIQEGEGDCIRSPYHTGKLKQSNDLISNISNQMNPESADMNHKIISEEFPDFDDFSDIEMEKIPADELEADQELDNIYLESDLFVEERMMKVRLDISQDMNKFGEKSFGDLKGEVETKNDKSRNSSNRSRILYFEMSSEDECVNQSDDDTSYFTEDDSIPEEDSEENVIYITIPKKSLIENMECIPDGEIERESFSKGEDELEHCFPETKDEECCSVSVSEMFGMEAEEYGCFVFFNGNTGLSENDDFTGDISMEFQTSVPKKENSEDFSNLHINGGCERSHITDDSSMIYENKELITKNDDANLNADNVQMKTKPGAIFDITLTNHILSTDHDIPFVDRNIPFMDCDSRSMDHSDTQSLDCDIPSTDNDILFIDYASVDVPTDEYKNSKLLMYNTVESLSYVRGEEDDNLISDSDTDIREEYDEMFQMNYRPRPYLTRSRVNTEPTRGNVRHKSNDDLMSESDSDIREDYDEMSSYNLTRNRINTEPAIHRTTENVKEIINIDAIGRKKIRRRAPCPKCTESEVVSLDDDDGDIAAFSPASFVDSGFCIGEWNESSYESIDNTVILDNSGQLEDDLNELEKNSLAHKEGDISSESDTHSEELSQENKSESESESDRNNNLDYLRNLKIPGRNHEINSDQLVSGENTDEYDGTEVRHVRGQNNDEERSDEDIDSMVEDGSEEEYDADGNSDEKEWSNDDEHLENWSDDTNPAINPDVCLHERVENQPHEHFDKLDGVSQPILKSEPIDMAKDLKSW